MNFFASLPHRHVLLDGTSNAALPGTLSAVSAPGAVRDAALSLATQLDVGRAATGSVDVRRLPGGGVELLLITPAARIFDITSHWPDVTVFSDRWQDDGGTCLLVRVQPGANAPDLPFGVIERPLAGAPFSGDTWAMSATPEALTLMVVDGLGHGPLAQNAAVAGVDALRAMPPSSPPEELRLVHDALKGTVGAAGAVARIDPAHKFVDFCGLGNIEAALSIDDRRCGFASYPGVVGQGSPTFRTYRYVLEQHTRLVMHTDGMRANWSPAKYPGLFERHPALIAGVLLRDFWRQSDDALVFVVEVSVQAHAVLAHMPG
jgi:hypothetical protein